MQAKDRKKIAAALAAVGMFMERPDEVSVSLQEGVRPANGALPATAWSVYGRTYSMNIRVMWQTRIYK